MQFLDERGGKRGPGVGDRPALHCQVGQSQLLKVSLFWLRREILLQRRLNVLHTRLLSLDQVRVVGVHPTGEFHQLTPQWFAHLRPQPGRLLKH